MHCGATAVMSIARLALTRSIHTANVSTITFRRLVSAQPACQLAALHQPPQWPAPHQAGRRPPSLDRPPWSPIHHPRTGIRRHRASRSLRHCDGSHRAARRSGDSSRCQLCDAPPSLGRPPKQDDGQPPKQRLKQDCRADYLPRQRFPPQEVIHRPVGNGKIRAEHQHHGNRHRHRIATLAPLTRPVR